MCDVTRAQKAVVTLGGFCVMLARLAPAEKRSIPGFGDSLRALRQALGQAVKGKAMERIESTAAQQQSSPRTALQ